MYGNEGVVATATEVSTNLKENDAQRHIDYFTKKR
jgi:hypothetical protein